MSKIYEFYQVTSRYSNAKHMGFYTKVDSYTSSWEDDDGYENEYECVDLIGGENGDDEPSVDWDEISVEEITFEVEDE